MIITTHQNTLEFLLGHTILDMQNKLVCEVRSALPFYLALDYSRDGEAVPFSPYQCYNMDDKSRLEMTM